MAEDLKHDLVVVLDFGSQYSQLIARRVRESNVYCEIIRYDISWSELKKRNPKAIILSGGPASVTADQSPACDTRILQSGVPVLGICYGLQLIAKLTGGSIIPATEREYGQAELIIDNREDLFYKLGGTATVWMSHGDRVESLPPEFEVVAHTGNAPIAAVCHKEHKLYGVQFHPEVVHTPRGKQILQNFLFRIAVCSPTWTMHSFIQYAVDRIRNEVGNGKVLCALSGGVDSSVAAALIHRAIGENLHCIFVNNGLLRAGEQERVEENFRDWQNVWYVDASARFLRQLKGTTDPEKKRRIIGNEFIRVFEEEAQRLGKVDFLAQGTLYPDVIESRSAWGGPSATIKTHHNVGGLPEKMGFKLIEPLKELFKDEVRLLGKELGLPDELVWRQPFPGPGLAVRIINEVTPDYLRILQHADAIVEEEMCRDRELYRSIWQSFAVLLPVKTVGVMGDERTYENVIALRVVSSSDAMTADWVRLPGDLLGRISNRIINEVAGVNRVVYDISSKPPSTIEWE